MSICTLVLPNGVGCELDLPIVQRIPQEVCCNSKAYNKMLYVKTAQISYL